jgi:pimeloyl-ACP methyl ester carboxylesterase
MRAISELLPRGRLEEVEGTGHAMILTHPEKVAPRVIRFLGR